jgi:hypothetical protein
MVPASLSMNELFEDKAELIVTPHTNDCAPTSSQLVDVLL